MCRSLEVALRNRMLVGPPKLPVVGALFVLCVLSSLGGPGIRAEERSYPASMQSFQIPSHGSELNAFVYVAAGAGPHPAVVLLHGFPGNERNLDLAQDIRRAGWDVLYFDYRGSWGSAGDFSFAHGIEDTAAAVDYLRSPTMARILRLDPSRIVLIGHSLGGFMAVQDAAADSGIIGVGSYLCCRCWGTHFAIAGEGPPTGRYSRPEHLLRTPGNGASQRLHGRRAGT